MKKSTYAKNAKSFLKIVLILTIVCMIISMTACANGFDFGGGSSSGGGNSSDDGEATHTPQLFTRAARNSDITIDTKDDFSLSMKYTFIANVDITGLEISFTYLDSSKKTVTTVKKYIGNVVKGNQYEVTVSLTEFSLSEIFKIAYSSCSVTGGTVSYFA